MAAVTASNARASDVIRYDRGEIRFDCMQIDVRDLATGKDTRKPETFMLMYFPGSGILQGADQFVADYRQGSMTASARQPDKLTASFTSQKGAQSYAGSVTLSGRQVGDEYDQGKEPIPLSKVPLSFVFTSSAEGGGRREAFRYKGFCTQPKYQKAAGPAVPTIPLEPGCFMNNGEKFCK